MANECLPLFDPGSALTATASAAVTGKRFVGVTGALNAATGVLPTVAHATAATRALGVAVRDTASGARLTVETRPGSVVPVTCAAAITAGAEVEVGSTGRATTLAAGKPVGQALSTTTAADTDVFVRLY